MSRVYIMNLQPDPLRCFYIKRFSIYILRLRGRFHSRRTILCNWKKWGCWKNGISLLLPVTVFVVVTIVGPIHWLIIKTEEAYLLVFIAAFLTETVSTFLKPREIVRLHSAYCTCWHVHHLLRKLAKKSSQYIYYKQVCCMDSIIMKIILN